MESSDLSNQLASCSYEQLTVLVSKMTDEELLQFNENLSRLNCEKPKTEVTPQQLLEHVKSANTLTPNLNSIRMIAEQRLLRLENEKKKLTLMRQEKEEEEKFATTYKNFVNSEEFKAVREKAKELDAEIEKSFVNPISYKLNLELEITGTPGRVNPRYNKLTNKEATNLVFSQDVEPDESETDDMFDFDNLEIELTNAHLLPLSFANQLKELITDNKSDLLLIENIDELEPIQQIDKLYKDCCLLWQKLRRMVEEDEVLTNADPDFIEFTNPAFVYEG